MIPKQDRQGIRNFDQLARRYNLDGVNEDAVAEIVKQISQVGQHLTMLNTTIEQKLNFLLSNNQSWFFTGAPTLENYPTAEWVDTTQKDIHVGDFYYDIDSGNVYIFTKSDDVYEWKSCFSGGKCDVDHDALRQEGWNEGYLEGIAKSKKVKTGSFILETDERQPIIEHKCNFVPSVFIVYPITDINDTETVVRRALGCVIINDGNFNDLNTSAVYKPPHFIWERQDTVTTWYGVSAYLAELTESTVTLPYRSGTYIWKKGYEYGWKAIE